MEDSCMVDMLTVITPTTQMQTNREYSGNPPSSHAKEWTESTQSVSPLQFKLWSILQLIFPPLYFFMCLFPVMGIIYAFLRYLPCFQKEIIPHVPVIFVLFPFAYLFFMVLLTFFFVIFKPIIIRLYSKRNPVASETFLLLSIYNMFEEIWHYYCGTYFHGTFWMRLVHSLIGVKIGANTLMFTRVKFPDQVIIGDNCIVESDTDFGSMLVRDGETTVGEITVGHGCIIGKKSVLKAGAKLTDNVVVTHCALVE